MRVRLGRKGNKYFFSWLKEINDLVLPIIIIDGRGCFISEIVLHTSNTLRRGVNDMLRFPCLLPTKTKRIEEFYLKSFKYFSKKRSLNEVLGKNTDGMLSSRPYF